MGNLVVGLSVPLYLKFQTQKSREEGKKHWKNNDQENGPTTT